MGLVAACAVRYLSIAMDAQATLIERSDDGFERWSIAAPTWGYVAAVATGLVTAAAWLRWTSGSPQEGPRPAARPTSVTVVSALLVVGALGSLGLGLVAWWLSGCCFEASPERDERLLLGGLTGGAAVVGVAALLWTGKERRLVLGLSGAVVLGLVLWVRPGPGTTALALLSWLALVAGSEPPRWRAWLVAPLTVRS